MYFRVSDRACSPKVLRAAFVLQTNFQGSVRVVSKIHRTLISALFSSSKRGFPTQVTFRPVIFPRNSRQNKLKRSQFFVECSADLSGSGPSYRPFLAAFGVWSREEQ